MLAATAKYATSYQWTLGGVALSGATSANYFVAGAISMDSGVYKVTAINAAGSATSNVARLTVGSSIALEPTSLSVTTTQTATFSVSATGAAPFKYQWYVIPQGISTGTAVLGATSNLYTTPPTTTSFDGAKYYATVTDSCGTGPLVSSSALLSVSAGSAPPTITAEPTGQTVVIGGTTSFNVGAAGTPNLTYQWYRTPSGGASAVIPGAISTRYVVPPTATTQANDQDTYFAVVTNGSGTAKSQPATLAVGGGILIQILDQPTTVYTNEGDSATFSINATSSLPLTYQWYEAAPGSSFFIAIVGATDSKYTQDSTSATDSGSVFNAVVSNGSTSSVKSNSASLFVGALAGIGDFCASGWTALGNAKMLSGCIFQLTDAAAAQHGEIIWPTLVATGNLQLAFTLSTSNPSTPAADGFAVVLGDPSLGATTTSLGATGKGLGAEGIPGFVLAFDDYYNPSAAGFPGDPGSYTNPTYLGVGRGETALWEDPYFNVNTNLPGGANALSAPGKTVSHAYVVSIVQGNMTVTMDGSQVFSGSISVPPVAYLYVTASTGASYEQTVISNFTATIVAPAN
jgi:hypothetical protein